MYEPHNKKYRADVIDTLAAYWAAGLTSTVISEKMRIKRGSICRLVATLRTNGDTRFHVRRHPVAEASRCAIAPSSDETAQDEPAAPARITLPTLRFMGQQLRPN